jgi:hypothetical protein
MGSNVIVPQERGDRHRRGVAASVVAAAAALASAAALCYFVHSYTSWLRKENKSVGRPFFPGRKKGKERSERVPPFFLIIPRLQPW